ncbi:hypothetical protein M2134_001841 [Parabacteroides sp. PM6-13]|uniref:hypothetical protein n=1 Tax=Parabacteroides sp. PM6-13 TaxID=1742408 RepID=UPI002477001B|nr:hypothetical protein [Parabacteroides sp. PM6-13]MDH6342963.1 hypothetical protein [Parabacteroides sp. PM6-13]
MRTIYSTISILCLLLAGMSLFQSCAEETQYDHQAAEVKEGIAISLDLPYGVNSPKVQTKSDQETEVYDLYVIVFDRYGKYKQKKYFTESDLTSNKLTLETTTGMKRLFAVANVGSNNFNQSPGDLKAQIDAFFASPNRRLEEWLGESATMADNYTGWTSLEFLLSGRFGKPGADGRVDASGLCLFDMNEQGKGIIKQSDGSALTPDCKIWLDRTISSVTFNIKSYKDSQREVIFHPISWEIRNLPRTVLFYNDYVRDMTGKNKEGNYFTTDTFTPDPDQFDGKIQNGTFQFYMLENGQLDNPFTGTGSLNDLRKTHAPGQTAMIVLKGEYEGKENNPLLPGNPTQTAKADVTYYIPLGFVYGDNPAFDFSVRRNHKYTYNVTVKSVNSIIIEAIGEDPSPSSDGDVVFKDGITIELDAHYSRIPLEFTKSDLINEDGFYFCSVKTAKTGWRETFITNDPTKQNDEKADIDWVLFADKKVIDERENGRVAPYGPNFSDPNDYVANNPNGCLYTVRDLMNWYANNQQAPERVTFYAYVNEHTYKASDNVAMEQYLCYRSDMLSSRTRSMKIGLKAAYRKEDNSDYNSSVISAKYVLDQLPIVTIFDVQKKQVKEGLFWGLECINENVPASYYTRNAGQEDFDHKAIDCAIPYGRTGSNPVLTADYDGRELMRKEIQETLKLNTEKVWFKREIMGDKRADGTWDQHKASAFAACMSRNRDKNGNGMIDENEIEWYLPSINQYQHFWVGTNAIPERVTLYPQEIREWNYAQRGRYPIQQRETFAYYASGGHSFQADEGSAVRGWGDNGESGRRKHVRCARNISAGSGSPTKVEIGTMEDGNGYIVIDASALTSSSHRPDGIFTNRTLPAHNEYDPENRLYTKIAVRKLIKPTSYATWIALANAVRDGYNPCSDYNTGDTEMERGWRPPNQRELILLTTIGKYPGLNSSILFAATYSSLWDWTKKNGTFGGEPLALKIEKEGAGDKTYNMRYGYFFNAAIKTPQMQLPYPGFEVNNFTSAITVRCVKDMK